VGRRRAGGGGEIGVAEAILDAGLARYRPDAAAHPCRDLLLAAEAEARAGKTGLWADPFTRCLRPATAPFLPVRAKPWCSSKAL
jgi:endonuclease YncB( thermonuclease family)